MGWGSWKRESRGTSEGDGGQGGDRAADGAGTRLPEAVVLGIVAERLSALSGRPWQVQGSLVKGPGTAAVALGEDHTGSPGHLDLVFLLNIDRPGETDVVDCATGVGGTLLEKVERAVDTWAGTTAAAVLETMERQGRLAGHFTSTDPSGFAGWHAVHGGIIGWGLGDDHGAVRDWAVEHPLLPVLSRALATEGLPREHLVGVKVFFGGAVGEETAEVRVNGRVSAAASRAVRDLPWPRSATGVAYARTFVLLVHPEDDPQH